jgi:hypothetical protein
MSVIDGFVEMRCSNRGCHPLEGHGKLLGYMSSTGTGVVRMRCPRCKHDTYLRVGILEAAT